MAAVSADEDRMSECRQIESLLPPYVDGDAPPDIAARVEAHLATCSACRNEVAVQRTARTVLRARSAQLAVHAPPGLRTRLAASMVNEPAPSLGWWGRVAAFGAAAAVLFAALSVFELTSPRSNVLFAAQLALDHLRCFVVEIASVEEAPPSEVRRLYAERYGWNVHVPPSDHTAGVTLVAARRCPFWLGDHAHLLYRSGDHQVSLFISQGEQRGDATMRVLGHTERLWSAKGDTYAIVARGVPQPELDRIAAYLEQQTRTD
jgi:anti-sigma factor RsiW